MKKYIYSLVLFISLFTTYELHAQCSDIIKSTQPFEDMVMVKTNWQFLVVRGSYTYGLDLENTEDGIIANFTSKGGVELEEGDEIIFADAAQNREPYRFVGMGKVHSEGGLPLNTNILQLDEAAIKRFASTRITVIYIKNNSRNEMRKFTVNANRQAEFQQMAKCFLGKISGTKIAPSKSFDPRSIAMNTE